MAKHSHQIIAIILAVVLVAACAPTPTPASPSAAVSIIQECSTMALGAPFPELHELLAAIGEAGRRVSDIDASEGAAGNDSISKCLASPVCVARWSNASPPSDIPTASR